MQPSPAAKVEDEVDEDAYRRVRESRGQVRVTVPVVCGNPQTVVLFPAECCTILLSSTSLGLTSTCRGWVLARCVGYWME
jgi:hypothetical protein